MLVSLRFYSTNKEVNPSAAFNPTIFVPLIATNGFSLAILNAWAMLRFANFRAEHLQYLDELSSALATGGIRSAGVMWDKQLDNYVIAAFLPADDWANRENVCFRESNIGNFFGFAQVGFAQVGSVQVGSAQVGSVQVGFAQVGFVQVGFVQVGSAQVGSVQVGSAQVGSVQVGSAQVGSVQVGFVQVGFAQVGFVQVGSVQVGSVQDGSAQVGSLKVGSAQVGSAQVG